MSAPKRSRAMKLTKEEKELLRSVERDDWRVVTNRADLRKYKKAARNTLKKLPEPSSASS